MDFKTRFFTMIAPISCRSAPDHKNPSSATALGMMFVELVLINADANAKPTPLTIIYKILHR